MGFATGRLVLRRHFMRGHDMGRVWAGYVAADDGHGLWLWVADGSCYRDVEAADGRAFRQVPFADWANTAKTLRERRWRGDVLMLHPPGAACSVWFCFAPDGRFRCWYVNLERPGVRWDDGAVAGIDTIDQDLDLVIGPDRSWRWKDEDEFAAHLARPDLYWVPDPEAVWAAGRAVVKLVEAGEFPFDGTACDYRPDPQWTVPTALPAGWDRARPW